jgi:hypothetical protein
MFQIEIRAITGMNELLYLDYKANNRSIPICISPSVAGSGSSELSVFSGDFETEADGTGE